MEHRFEVFENAERFFFMMRLVLGHNKHPEPIFLKLMTLPSKGDLGGGGLIPDYFVKHHQRM